MADAVDIACDVEPNDKIRVRPRKDGTVWVIVYEGNDCLMVILKPETVLKLAGTLERAAHTAFRGSD